MNIKTDDPIEIAFSGVRISRSATIMLDAEIEKVFPLFGPLREKEWAPGWEPEMLYGNDEVNIRNVFRTKASIAPDQHYLWIISQFDPLGHSIECTVVAHERVWFIAVECTSRQSSTLATVTYTYIGLTPEGHGRNQKAMGKIFSENLADWEQAVNYYLVTEKKFLTIKYKSLTYGKFRTQHLGSDCCCVIHLCHRRALVLSRGFW